MMYLSHFGLSEHPFNHRTGSNFFFEGGNRGATLDALIYLLTRGEGGEGIVKVIGEDGSGKTTLCRLLMQRLPPSVELIYLAQQNLSREVFLHTLSEKLGFESSGSRAIPAPAVNGMNEPEDELQRVLTQMLSMGAQIVLLIDEAHALPEETLEALETLSERQSRHKALRIILVGRTRLDETLALPQMRKVRDQVTHHFSLQPFTAKVVKNYLTWRLCAVGYRGSDIFVPRAIRLITMASWGRIPQLDVLATNSLRVAYADQSPVIDASHVKAAIKDVGIKHGLSWRNWRLAQDLPDRRRGGAGAVLSVMPLAAAALLGWNVLRSPATSNSAATAPVPFEASASAPLLAPVPSSAYPSTVTGVISSSPPSATAAVVPSNVAAETKAHVLVPTPDKQPAPAVQHSTTASIGGVKLTGYELLEQRVEATAKAFGTTARDAYTIQLFSTDNVQPDRMERFLSRARSLVDLSDLYVYPVTNGGKAKFRVTYGVYASRDQATAAVAVLPEKYQASFQPEIYAVSEIN
ncbi:AAA family ATPase [Nitrosospira sp. Nsp2]|uniref:AAA family ATPase n=1 Tax=Nitrosospira sp. Nsp2 TaxID=136548 RepID=UPI0015E765EB|nr:AAA family ATPase [Nitrosospira sp. Nsp2]